jgi:mono/diheme cytochrome c family protein
MRLLLTLVSATVFFSAIMPSQEDELTKSIQRGKMVYSENCITCHMGSGEGVPTSFPPLTKSDYFAKNPENAIRAIKFGLIGKIKVNGVEYDNMMPNPGLGNDEIADVVNYITNSWGNTSDKKMITESMVIDTKEKK